MLTTHFIRLCNLFDKQKYIRNYNMETSITDDNIPSYTYKLTTGISKIKGGIVLMVSISSCDFEGMSSNLISYHNNNK